MTSTPKIKAITASALSMTGSYPERDRAENPNSALAFPAGGPAFVNPLKNQFGVRDGVRNSALPRGAGLASGFVQFSRCRSLFLLD